MLGTQSVVALVPARGGSKGLPGKNLADAGGQPLITWTIQAAAASTIVDRVVVSTDDARIAEVVARSGAEVLPRPAALAQDESTAQEVIAHALTELPEAVLLYLQPTSPLRTADDIDSGSRLLLDSSVRAVVSVCADRHPPEWSLLIDEETGLLRTRTGAPIPRRRQDTRLGYSLNGALYGARREDWLPDGDIFRLPLTPYVMRAQSSIDIDDEEDLGYADYLLTRRRNQRNH